MAVDATLTGKTWAILRIVVLLGCLVPVTGAAGSWNIQQTLTGSGWGHLDGPPGCPTNSINGLTIPDPGSVTVPSTDPGIDTLNSRLVDAQQSSASANAYTSGFTMHYTLTWVPDPNKPTDPAPSKVTVLVTLGHRQWVAGNTATAPASIAATATLTAFGTIFPDISGSASGSLAGFNNNSGTGDNPFWDTVKVKTLAVASGQATLDVSMVATTQVSYSVPGNSILAPVPRVVADTYCVPGLNTAGIVLVSASPLTFPERNAPDDGANRYCYSNTAYPTPGVLVNPDWQSRVYGMSASLLLPFTSYTSFDIAGAVRTNEAISVSGDLIRQHFTYTALPQSNGSFGTKWVEMDCQLLSTVQRAEVQVFFPKLADNHPDPDLPRAAGVDRTPNWYYYWEQTSAKFGTHIYGGSQPGESGATSWDGSKWTSYIYDGACGHAANPLCWGGAEGIDFYANLCRHEEKHRTDFTSWWPSGVVGSLDVDGDWIPDPMEHDLTTAAHLVAFPDEYYRSNSQQSAHDDLNYGPGPGGFVIDDEDYTMHTEAPWTNGAADKEDWSHSGHQWR